MKLQKLIYFVYRQFLQDYGKQILSDNFLVWQYGPVLQSVYDEFKSFRANQITRFAKDAKNNVYIVNESINKELSSVITDVWDKYKQYIFIGINTPSWVCLEKSKREKRRDFID